MTRNGLNFSLIPNLSARKICFKKRKSGLLKKVNELSTLCDVEAFMIIYSPYDPEPTVWPSRHVVQERLEKYHNSLGTQHAKNRTNHEGYLRWGIEKMNENSKKQAEFNKIVEMQYLMYQINQGSNEVEGLVLSEKYTALKILLDKAKAIRTRINHLQVTSQPLSSYHFHPTDPILYNKKV